MRDIAAELGHGITPNAVIAKIHRLGIADLSPFGGAPGRRWVVSFVVGILATALITVGMFLLLVSQKL